MSSEGSVTSSGSQIRQFGLYRTIDARTEEFLRSSRKRQIRQGCACAAISTAITVTVVVSVVLVYEYSIHSGTNNNPNKKNSIKHNWIGLINDSDITSISSKFNKKINFDKTTLKLLPILLKALNKNRYLEKILEEYSSSSAPYVDKDSTEATFTRNIFSDSKYWLKLPTTRLYSTDYKTSPLMQWKTPTKRLEYLTKIRKIRDYQRMLNYFDKMINDKVGLKREFDYTENPLTAETVSMKKDKKFREIQQLSYQRGLNRKETKSEGSGVVDCSCPKKLGLLLSKLVSALQDFIPQVIGDKVGLNMCKNKTKNIDVLRKLTTTQTVRPTKHLINNLSTLAMSPMQKSMKKSLKDTKATAKCCNKSPSSSTTTSTSTSTIAITTPIATTTNAEISKQATARNEFEIKPFGVSLIQESIKGNNKIPEDETLEKTSARYTTSLITPTESPYIYTTRSPKVKHRTTEAIEPIRFISKSSTDKWLQAYALDLPYKRLDLPVYKEEEYDDYFNNKPNKRTEFDNIDVQSTESLKTLGVGGSVNKINNNPASTQQDLDLTSMRKLADMIYLPQEKIAKVWKYTIEPELPSPSHKKYKQSGLQTNSEAPNSIESTSDSTISNIISSSLKNIHLSNSALEVTPHLFNTEPMTSENVGDDDFQDELSRPTESTVASNKYFNSSKSIDTDESIAIQNANPWTSVKTEEKTIESVNSMLPALRPIYLEIQRNNDWRQDEQSDYDLYNINNMFDLPNIE